MINAAGLVGVDAKGYDQEREADMQAKLYDAMEWSGCQDFTIYEALWEALPCPPWWGWIAYALEGDEGP